MEALFGKTVNMLSAMLHFKSDRHKLITSNIANVDTPGYKSKELTFQRELDSARGGEGSLVLRKTDKRHFPTDSVSFGKVDSTVVNSGKKVNIDTEMVNLAENHLRYNLTVEFLTRKFRSIKNVLREVR